MPELPEVTTICRILKPKILNKTFKNICFLYPKLLINKEVDQVKNLIINSTITDITNIGKIILIKLSNNYQLIIHLRMEGKLFYFENKEQLPSKKQSDSCLMEFTDNSFLLYNDTRKFGLFKLEKQEKEENSLLANLGLDIFNYTNEDFNKLIENKNNTSDTIKQFITNQHMILGIGNIYADEILFKSQISPFKKARELNEDSYKTILTNAKEILSIAIDNKGSTISSYHPDFNTEGGFQNFLKVYDKKGELCPICKTKIEKRFLSGRGTSFCPHCQHVEKSYSLTGPISSGKSTALNIFKELNFTTLSIDEVVHKLYEQKSYIKQVETLFPELIINNKISKQILTEKLKNPYFKKQYESFLYPKLKDYVNTFLNKNFDKKVVVEIPLLFESNMQTLFSYNIGITSNKQEELIKQRDKDYKTKLEINKNSLFYKNINKLDYIIENNSTKEELKTKILTLLSKLN